MYQAFGRANLAVRGRVFRGEESRSMFDQQAQQFGGLFEQAQDQSQQTARPLRL